MINYSDVQDGRRKITREQTEKIRELHKNKMTIKELSYVFNVSISRIAQICNPEYDKRANERKRESWKKYYTTEKRREEMRKYRAKKKLQKNIGAQK
jgi:hypothetical protein